MFKKFFEIANAIFCLFLLLAFGIVVARAQQNQTQTSFPVYLPAAFNQLPVFYNIEGRVVNSQNTGIAGVTIRTDKGQQTTTDQTGAYKLSGLATGTYTITPSKSGITFSPASTTVNVPPSITTLNFTANVQCSELVSNGGFESSTSWVIPLTEYSAGYTTTEFHSGSHSMRTGIANPVDNRASDSTTQQKVVIPSGTTTASFTFWIKPYSSVTGTLSLPPKPAEGTPLDGIQSTSDVQYVLVLDSNLKIINTLLWQLSNSRTWTKYEFNLAQYAGKTIWLHFGTTNDGLNGVSSMFVDDVSLITCPYGSTPTPSPTPTRTPTPTVTPTPRACQELITNNKFDLNTGWIILDTAYHAGYSTTKYHSPSRSMRTGIVNLADNVESYSDFRQVVTIPASAHHVTLSTWEYFSSSETTANMQVERIAPTGKPFDETLLSDDIQYLLILDQNKNWIDTLLWQRGNSQTWTNIQFDLSAYAGKTIMLQWGTYNNGTSGITSMYVDDVTLQACQ